MEAPKPYLTPVANQKIDWPLHPHFGDYLRKIMKNKAAVASTAIAGLVAILAATTDIPKKVVTSSGHAVVRFLDSPYQKIRQYTDQHQILYPVTLEDIKRADPTDADALRRQVEESRKVPEIPQMDPNIHQILGPPNPPE